MGRPQSTAGGRPVVVSVRFSEAEAKVLDSQRGSVSRAAYLRALVPSHPVVSNPPVIVGEESAVEEEAHPSTAPPVQGVVRPDPMPSTANPPVAEKLVTNHRHKRVKTGTRFVKGQDVGEWACKECGTVLT